MGPDTIFRKILANKELKEKYWPEITDIHELNLSNIATNNNLYLRFISAILIERPDSVRKTMISNLLN